MSVLQGLSENLHLSNKKESLLFLDLKKSYKDTELDTDLISKVIEKQVIEILSIDQ